MDISNYNKLLSEWGIDTAYASKYHFKSADYIQKRNIVLLIIIFIFSIISLLKGLNYKYFYFFSIIPLIASILLLIYESKEGFEISKKHMHLGHEYLCLHKEIQMMYYEGNVKEEQINKVKLKLLEIIKSDNLSYPCCVKLWVNISIKKNNEINQWWSIK
ncbi:MAG: hypothetical protein M1576_04205 [Deltaproteobacteria bacterium]|jgi:hypothetical protein|nr:hypothetical protein [Deltaproteobacteria bacterium]